jgi:hypothetical protein
MGHLVALPQIAFAMHDSQIAGIVGAAVSGGDDVVDVQALVWQ